MDNYLKAKKGTLQQCSYSLVDEGPSTLIRLDCDECGTDADLSNEICVAGIINAFSDVASANAIILGTHLVSRYSSSAVSSAKAMARVLKAIRDLTNSSGKNKGCTRCVAESNTLSDRLEHEFLKGNGDLEPLIDNVNDELSKNRRGECKGCIIRTKDELSFIKKNIDTALRTIIKFSPVRDRPVMSTAGSKEKEMFRLMKKALEDNRAVRPGFSSSWITRGLPRNSELVSRYDVGSTTVRIFLDPQEMENLYHITPRHSLLDIERIKLIHLAIEDMSNEKMDNVNLNDIEGVRNFIRNRGEKVIDRLSKRHGIKIGRNRSQATRSSKEMANIMASYTAGYGVLEDLLNDDAVQDIYIDAPVSNNPVYITMAAGNDHRMYGRCRTNVVLGDADVERLASKLQMASGRPFSAAQPILETDLPGYDTRVAAIAPPLSPSGVGMALRRHSKEPWSLLSLIDVGSLSPLGAGFLSFLIDGKATMLVAGSRGAGKSSLLGALMLEFPKSQRMLTMEDTPELPISAMQRMGYKVQSLSINSLKGGLGEVGSDDALKVSLRLGESAIVMGEVRGQEARTLYEAMRAGSAGSSVLGTFHADSAKGVYHRVVHDMGVSAESFSATDAVIIAGLERPKGTLKARRRVSQMAELIKDTGEGEFRDLFRYDEGADTLLETEDLRYHSELIGRISASWGMKMEDALENIRCRGEIRKAVISAARAKDRKDLLRSRNVPLYNQKFWSLQEMLSRRGTIDHEELLREWTDWFHKEYRLEG